MWHNLHFWSWIVTRYSGRLTLKLHQHNITCYQPVEVLVKNFEKYDFRLSPTVYFSLEILKASKLKIPLNGKPIGNRDFQSEFSLELICHISSIWTFCHLTLWRRRGQQTSEMKTSKTYVFRASEAAAAVVIQSGSKGLNKRQFLVYSTNCLRIVFISSGHR